MTSFSALIEHHKKRSTGYLVLKDGELQKSFIFKKGEITFIESNSRDETLGALLVAEGRITQDQQLEIINKMVETGKMQGDILIEMGILSPAEVFEYLNRQMVLKLKRSLQLRNCTVIFSEKMPMALPDFSIPLMRTLIDGLMEHYNPQYYKEEGGFNRDAILKLTESGKMNVGKLNANADETKTLRLLKATPTIANFISKSSNKRFAAAFLFLFDKMGYLEVEEAKKRVTLDQLFDDAVHAIDYDAKSTAAEAVASEPEPAPTTDPADPQNRMYTLLLRLQKMNYFEVLQLPQECSSAEAERAYYSLIRSYHLGNIDSHYEEKDRDSAKQLLDTITLAYSILGDQKKREKYTNEIREQKTGDKTEVDPKLLAEAQTLKAEMYMRLGNYTAAIAAANEAVGLFPKEAAFYVTLAQAQMKMDLKQSGEPSHQVEEYLRKAVEISPQYHFAYLELGYYFKHRKNQEKAAAFFQKAVDTNPNCRAAETELRLIDMRSHKKKGLFAGLRKKPGES